MITERKALSMSEAQAYIDKENAETKAFIKKFISLDSKKAKELREKLVGLDLMKLKEEHIVKLVDLLPETDEEVNKVCSGVGLNEDEIKKVIDTIKEYK